LLLLFVNKAVVWSLGSSTDMLVIKFIMLSQHTVPIVLLLIFYFFDMLPHVIDHFL
jgi:hypothetical protein